MAGFLDRDELPDDVRDRLDAAAKAYGDFEMDETYVVVPEIITTY